jgi:hypothetical protein
MVQMMFPVKKHARVFTNESRGIKWKDDIGRKGDETNGGSGPVNWNRERTKR